METVTVHNCVKASYQMIADLKASAPACRLLFDLDADCIKYKTVDGKKRQVTDNLHYSANIDAARVSYGSAVNGARGAITFRAGHECYTVAAVAAGYIDSSTAIYDAENVIGRAGTVAADDAAYIKYTPRPDTKRKKEIKETIELAAKTADQVACIIKIVMSQDGIPTNLYYLAHSLERVAAAAAKSGIALTAGKHCAAVAEWINKIIAAGAETTEAQEERPETILISRDAQEPEAAPGDEKKEDTTMKKYAAYYEDFPSIPRIFPAQNKRDAEKDARRYRRAWGLPALIRVDCLANDEADKLEKTVNEFIDMNLEILKKEKESLSQAEPEAAAPETVQAEPEAAAPEAVQAEPEAAAPETIQAEQEAVAPETVQAEPEAAAPETVQAEPEAAAPEAVRADGNKPARGPAKPKEFVAEALTGRGWCIVFDTGMQRTRVIVQDGIRETVAPIIQEAGFYWSDNMRSYNKKLTHRAHRAALALAEKLTAATA